MPRAAWIAAPLIATLLPAGAARAGILWNEQINGDFSGDRFHPTPLVLPPGMSEVFGRIEDGGGGDHIDLDFYSLTIPAGYRLSSMLLENYLSIDFNAFMAISPGPFFAVDPVTAGDTDLMGWTHFGPFDVGQDMLTLMGRHGQGFSPPLPAGTYTLWVQQLDNFTEYSVGFTVDPVPAPGSAAVALLAAGLTRRTRRTPAPR